MKLTSTFLLLSAIPAVAQTPAKAPVKSVHRPAAVVGCAKLPELSPKIPALPAGLPCAKPLYTVSIHAPVTIDYTAPAVSAAAVSETLHLQEATSFSLNYIDIQAGTGAPVAPHKWITVEYTGYLVDGTKFDSTADHPGAPFTFEYGQLGGPHSAIAGWETGFDGMKVGGKRRLFVPYQLGYGAQNRPKIPPKSLLIFDMELKALVDKDPFPAPPAGPFGTKPGGLPAGKPAPSATTPPTPATPPAAVVKSAPAAPPASTTPPPATPPAPATPPPTPPKP